MHYFITIWGLILLTCGGLFSQGVSEKAKIQNYLNSKMETLGLLQGDIDEFLITDSYLSGHNKIRHVHIQQLHKGVPVFNGVANFNISPDGTILSSGSRLVKGLGSMANEPQPNIGPEEAIRKALSQLGIDSPSSLEIEEKVSDIDYYFQKGNVSLENIRVKLVYQLMAEGELLLAWNVSVYPLGGTHWWQVRVDGNSGNILDKNDWVVSCDFGETINPFKSANYACPDHSHGSSKVLVPNSYNVFAIPVESPNHGSRSIVVDPADLQASPFGWHDTDGAAGSEFSDTRGNNVYAALDTDDNDTPDANGHADGGATLEFDFPLNTSQVAINYKDAAVTNLFYMNNIMHDVYYGYGFDEEGGNFQQNNYGNGGLGNDHVEADAQDGGGTNNANFATPDDGQNPRMQMYLWTGGGTSELLTINSPVALAGDYFASEATFGPGVPATPITADIVLAEDGVASPNENDACETITNAFVLNGKIAMIDRGDCNFTLKVEAAQDAGAIAVIMVNNVAGGTIPMGGTSALVTIPSIMISQADGDLMKAILNDGGTLNGTIVNDNPNSFDKDGDFDNGIIAHEYTHGISNRLTGGPGNSNCLFGDEQMGEGWSDWYGLMVTIDMMATNPVYRPIGTFASGEPTSGTGIRNAPYDTSFVVNAFTYGDVADAANVSVPHGVGFVWATMLWDLTWAFIDEYGFDSDVYHGTGGNNMVMQLVTDGLKLQPCNPGFVDGRDAILQADDILNGGVNRCLIWKVFAKRGCGVNADQGSGASRTDQVEDFGLPTFCQNVVAPPIAGFGASTFETCTGTVDFTDQSMQIPQQWDWDFGDGNTSTSMNPSHVYSQNGTYTVSLTVTNTLGSDVANSTVVVNLPAAPSSSDVVTCTGTPANLSANGAGEIRWLDNNMNLIGTGTNWTSGNINLPTIFYAQSSLGGGPSQNVGPANGNGGSGVHHGSTFTGTVNFTCDTAVTILSAFVDADGAGFRDLFLWNGTDGGGGVLKMLNVFIPDGQSRVYLDFTVPSAGDYSIGGTGVDLFRNDGGVNYPYSINGLISITGSSAGADYYYYLYDLEVQKASCLSPAVPVQVTTLSANFDFVTAGFDVSFTDQSTGGSNWAWDFGDGNTSTDQNPMHTFSSYDTFEVSLTIDGICTSTQTVIAGTVSLLPEDHGLSINLVPNPASDRCEIILNKSWTKDIQINISSVEGKRLKTVTLKEGSLSKMIPLESFADGVYFLEMSTEDFRDVRKLIINK